MAVNDEWFKYYSDKGFGSTFEVYDITTSVSGDVYLTGLKTNEIRGFDLVLLGMNASGDTLVFKEFENPDSPGVHEYGQNIKLDSEGNIIIVGSYFNNESSGQNYSLYKFNPTGELLWSYYYKDEVEYISSILNFDIAEDNRIILQGYFNGNNSKILHLSKDGELEKTIEFTGLNTHDFEYRIDASKNTIYQYNSHEIFKYDLDGNLLLELADIHLLNLWINEFLVDSNGYIYLLGTERESTSANYSYQAVKLSVTGNVIWNKKVSSAAYNISAVSAIFDQNEGIYMSCHERTQDVQNDIRILHFTSSGSCDINHKIPRTWGKWNAINQMICDNSGNLFLATINSSEMPTYIDVTQKVTIYKYNRAVNNWKSEIAVSDEDKLKTLHFKKSSTGDLYLFLNTTSNRNPYYQIETDYFSRAFSISASNGTINFENILKSKGHSKITSKKTIITDNGDVIVASFSNKNLGIDEFKILQYNKDGDLIWEYDFPNPDAFKVTLKQISYFDSEIKVLLNLNGAKDGSYLNYHAIVNLDGSGNVLSQKEIDYSEVNFISTPVVNGYYYLQYHNEDAYVISCYNINDEVTWTKELTGSEFVENAEITGITPSGNLIVSNMTGLHEVDVEANVVWSHQFDEETEINESGLVFDNDENIIFWFDKKITYNKDILGLISVSKDGTFNWSLTNDTITDCQRVWVNSSGDVFAFGDMNENIFGRYYSASTMLKFNKSGTQVSRTDLPVYPYDKYLPIVTKDKSYFFIPLPDKLVAFKDDGSCITTLKPDILKNNGSLYRINNLDYNATSGEFLLTGDITSKNSYDRGSWQNAFISKLFVSNLEDITNQAPQFVSKSDTIFYQTYVDIKAMDPDGDPILYTLAPDQDINIEVNPRIGYLNLNLGRGLYQFVIRATDPHGEYDELAMVAKLGNDNIPYIISQPIEKARELSSYSYQIKVKDLDRDPVTYSLSDDSPVWLTINEEGLITGTPPKNSSGNSFIVSAIIYEEMFDHAIRHTFTINVEDPNQPPVFVSNPQHNVELNSPYEYIIQYEDPESDYCMINMNSIPTWLTFNEETNTLKGVPQKKDFFSVNSVGILIEDEYGGTAIQEFSIDILHSNNSRPYFLTEPIKQSYEGFNYKYSPLVADLDDDEVEIYLREGPAFLHFSSYSNTIEGLIPTNSIGTYNIVIEALDFYGENSSQSFILEVDTIPAIPNNEPVKVVISRLHEKELTVEVTSLESRMLKLEIQDSIKNKVVEISFASGEIADSFSFDTSSWVSGKYLLQILWDEKRVMKSFTIE